MLEVIGEAAGQERLQAGIYSSVMDKGIAKPAGKRLPEEGSQQRENSKPEGAADERTKNRTKLESGNITIETYSEDGRLLKISPPGYLPFNKTA
jgi:hypothetical protein